MSRAHNADRRFIEWSKRASIRALRDRYMTIFKQDDPDEHWKLVVIRRALGRALDALESFRDLYGPEKKV